MAKEDHEQTTLGRRISNTRLAAIEQIEKRWDQAMDVIHGRPIRDPTRDDVLGGDAQFVAQVRERLDYQLSHPGPGEIAERHADLAGDATVDKSQITTIISREVAQARNKENTNMKPTLAEKKEADIEYWKGVISRDRAEIAETVQKVQASERHVEQPQAEAAVDRQVKKATSKVTPVVVAAIATSFVVNAQAQDINFLEQASRARNESLHIPQQKPLPAQPEQLLPSSGLTCARVDQWQPVRAQPSDAAPVLGYTQAQIAVEGAAGGGYAHVRYYNGKEGYLPQTSLKPSRTCSIAGVRPNGGPVFQYKAG